MSDRARVHSDGFGATFVGAGGYTAYRLLRHEPGQVFSSSEWAVVKERHQRHASTRVFRMPLRKWENLMEQAVDGECSEGGQS